MTSIRPEIAAYQALYQSQFIRLPLKIANLIGLKEAFLIRVIEDYCQLNAGKGQQYYFREECWWTKLSYSAIAQEYPCIGALKNVQRLILSLEKAGLLISGCFNETKQEKTKWYRVNQQAIGKLFLEGITTPRPPQKSPEPACYPDSIPCYSNSIQDYSDSIPCYSNSIQDYSDSNDLYNKLNNKLDNKLDKSEEEKAASAVFNFQASPIESCSEETEIEAMGCQATEILEPQVSLNNEKQDLGLDKISSVENYSQQDGNENHSQMIKVEPLAEEEIILLREAQECAYNVSKRPWRLNPSQFKPEVLKAVFEANPKWYSLPDGRPNFKKISDRLNSLERSLRTGGRDAIAAYQELSMYAATSTPEFKESAAGTAYQMRIEAMKQNILKNREFIFGKGA